MIWKFEPQTLAITKSIPKELSVRFSIKFLLLNGHRNGNSVIHSLIHQTYLHKAMKKSKVPLGEMDSPENTKCS